MAPLLLLCCFIHLTFQAKAQDHPVPKLTVDPAVVSETNNVTLNCQTHHVQEPDCYFVFDKHYKSLRSCQTALGGAELLSILKKRPPAEITVTCFYYYRHDHTYSDHAHSRSADSAERIINIGHSDLAPPSLIVISPVITKKEKVKLHCRPPHAFSSSQCHFYATNGQTWSNSRCEQTVRGSDLLTVNQNPPVEVQVQCYYVVDWGQEVSNSPYSEKISVTVQRTTENKRPNPQQWPKPEISFQKHDDEVLIFCSSPLSATGLTCNLYFGESTQPHQSINSRTKTKENEQLCQFYIPVDDFRTNLSKVQRKKVSCDYTLGDGSRSPRSDEHTSRTFISQLFPSETHKTTASFDPVKTTTRPGSDSETSPAGENKTTPPLVTSTSTVKITPGHVTGSNSVTTRPVTTTDPPDTTDRTGGSILNWVKPVTVCGVLLGCIILVLAFFCTKKRSENHRKNGSQDTAVGCENTENHPMKPVGHKPIKDDDDIYTLITSVPTADCSKGPVNVMSHHSTDDSESDPYHLYCTIPDPETTGSGSVDNVLYSSPLDLH